MRETKRVGPDLKEVRMKLRKEWIPVWLAQTHTFRQDEDAAIPPAAGRDPRHRRVYLAAGHHAGNLPLTRPAIQPTASNCCSSADAWRAIRIGEGRTLWAATFAANLSRVGEKDIYAYLVRWISNPRFRTRPYRPFEKRDLGPEDYAKQDLPFVFDLDHSRCPNDGHQLEVQQPTVMPNLRLADADSRDIASFLMTQKHADATYLLRTLWTIRSSRQKAKRLCSITAARDAMKSAGLKTKAASERS